MRLLKLLLVLFMCAAGPALAGPLEDGIAAAEKRDYATALRLLRPLAEQGNVDAQYNLGVLYYNGQGVPRDYAAALSWYLKAAEQGSGGALYNLGFMYRDGQGVPQDFATALRFWRALAELGYAKAQVSLGTMYLKGQGVPQDYVQAHKWYNLAASLFDASDKEGREIAVKNRDLVAAKMTPAQIAEAQKLAREWKPK